MEAPPAMRASSAPSRDGAAPPRDVRGTSSFMGGTPERDSRRSRSHAPGSPVRSLRSRRQVAKTRADRAATAPRKPMSLSQVLSHDAHCRDPARVSVVERCLTSIGKVPDRFAAATSVYLSKNSLTTLGGIQQFSDVRVLSLSNNLVADLEEIRVLQSCPHLRVLNLQENPVAWLPYYRWHALQMLPSLRTVDGVEISDADRALLPTILARETSTLHVMVQNECHLHQLRECLNRLRLHQSFHRTVHGRVGNLNGAANAVDDADPRRVLQMLPIHLSAEERQAYMTRLREWVKSLWMARASGLAPLILSRPGKESAAGAAPRQSKRVLTQANSPSSATTAQQIAGYDQTLRDSSITKATLRNQQAAREAGISKLSFKPRPLSSSPSDRSSTESWDEAYAEGLKQQQLLLAKLNSEVELAVDDLTRERRARQDSDPHGTLQEARHAAAMNDRQTKEQEARLVTQYRTTLNQLHDAHQKEYSDQEQQFEQELETLRAKLLKLSGSAAYVEALSHQIRRESAMGTPGRRRSSQASDLGTPEKMPEPISPVRSASPVYTTEHRSPSKNQRQQQHQKSNPDRRRRSAPATPEEEVRKNFRSRRVNRVLHQKRAQSVNAHRPAERSWAAHGPEPHPPDRRELKRMYDEVVSERDTLRTHQQMLIADIENRVETEKRLHAVNVELRGRLEGLHQEVDEDVHSNAQHKEIQRLTQALEAANAKNADDAALLSRIMEERVKDDMAEGFAEGNFLRARFHIWKHNARASKHFTTKVGKAMRICVANWSMQAVAGSFRQWVWAHQRLRFRKTYLARLVFQHHSYCFQLWLTHMKSVWRRRDALKSVAMRKWKEHTSLSRALPDHLEKIFKRLGMANFEGSRVQRSFRAWKRWLHDVQHPKLAMQMEANVFFRVLVVKAMFRKWVDYRQNRKVQQLSVAKQWVRRQNFWVMRCFAFWVRYPIQQLRAKAAEAVEKAATVENESGQYLKRHSIMEMEQEHLLKRCTTADNTVSAVRSELYERESTISRLEKMLQQKQLVETSLRTEISRRDLIEAEWHSEFGKRPEISELARGDGSAQWQSQQELELRSAKAQVERLKSELQGAHQEQDTKLSSAFGIAASLRGLLQQTLEASPELLDAMHKGEREEDDLDARLAALEKRATTKGGGGGGGGGATVLQEKNSNSPVSGKKKKKKRRTNLAGKPKTTTPGRKQQHSPSSAKSSLRSPVKDVLNLGERRRIAAALAEEEASRGPDVLNQGERRRAAEALAEARSDMGIGGGPLSDDWSAHQSAFAKLQARLDSMTATLDAESDAGGSGSGSGSGSDAGLLPGTSAVLAASDGSDSGNSSGFMQDASRPSVTLLCSALLATILIDR